LAWSCQYTACRHAAAAAAKQAAARRAASADKVGYAQASRPDALVAPGATGWRDASPFGTRFAAAPAFVPDLFAVLPSGISPAQVNAIGGLTRVRTVLAVDGGQVMINGRAAALLGVSSQAFRSWTPPATAADAGIWARLSGRQLTASRAAAGGLGIADLATLMSKVRGPRSR
jgi:hypothetical protein